MQNSAITSNSHLLQLSIPLEELKNISPSKFTSKYLLTVALIVTCITNVPPDDNYLKDGQFCLNKTEITFIYNFIAIFTMLTIIVPPLLFHCESAKLRTFDMFSNYPCVDQDAWI